MSYQPKPIDSSDITLPQELIDLTEKLAKNVHENWAEGRINDGWTYGPERADIIKTTPCLVEYEDLPESEREYDRNTAMETIKLILKLGYVIQKKNS